MRNRTDIKTRNASTEQRNMRTAMSEFATKSLALHAVVLAELQTLSSHREGVEAALFAIRYALTEVPGATAALRTAIAVAWQSPPDGTDAVAFRQPLAILFGADNEADLSGTH